MSLYYYAAAEMAHADDVARVAQARMRNNRTREDHYSFTLTDRAFIAKYRLSKPLTRSLIEDLRPHIAPTLRSDSLSVETKVLTTLRFLATGSYQALVGDSKNLSMCQASVSNVLHKVLEAINTPQLFKKYVAFPSSREGREAIKRRFYGKYAMPGVVGCVDGTHVAIVRPAQNEERYYNRKGYHSLNVMVVCDSDLMLLCVDPSYPGATHDSVVWNQHKLKEYLARLRATSGEEMYVLGDSGYPLRPTLMTPILHATANSPEAHYTETHIQARNVVESCIGVLKARWRSSSARRRSPSPSPAPSRSRSSRPHKHKKKSKKNRPSSSSSSGSGDEELRLLRRLEAERERLKLEKKNQKEQMKANETPEEKRARRLREKALKERRRREASGWDTEYQGYTDQDNPFGDSALTDTFVWGKKLAAQGVRVLDRVALEAHAKAKQRDNKHELEKVKARRLEREAERAAREAETSEAARAREAALYSSWERQEDSFHLNQAKLRTEIRIRDGRAKPIDLLAWYVSAEQSADALEMHEPYTYLRGLGVSDLEDLLADIGVYRALEPTHLAYWADVDAIARDELAALRRRRGTGVDAAAPRDAVHRAVADDVNDVFRGKSAEQLDALRNQVELKLRTPADNLDVTYWESLLGQLRAHQARARLRDRHQRNLRTKLALLKQEQGVADDTTAAAAADDTPPPPPPASTTPPPATTADGEGESSDEEGCAALYAAGSYTPPPLSPARLEPGTLLVEPLADEQRLAYLRARVLPSSAPSPAPAVAASSTSALEAAAARACGTNPDEAAFSVEHALPPEPCLWADKYRPRKPRYFNRVHTGFEWNKYNQTHYDMDNPPPKIVQGYKFNIFYPDLLDPSSTPSFSLKPCGAGGEFAVLRFSAGPPYEDIAFKIVNREWEYSYKRGFRCHFHNNIFQLWFHFKRYRYRR